MRYAARIRKTGIPRKRREADPRINRAHIAWIRSQNCAVEDENCAGNVEAAHVRTGTDGGEALKPSDKWTVPLCWHHHRVEQHNGEGERAFWATRDIDPKELAARYYRRSPARRDEE